MPLSKAFKEGLCFHKRIDEPNPTYLDIPKKNTVRVSWEMAGSALKAAMIENARRKIKR